MDAVPADQKPADPDTQKAMDHLKEEVAEDLGLDDDIDERGWGNMTTREVGKIGGNMVRRLVKKAENELPRE